MAKLERYERSERGDRRLEDLRLYKEKSLQKQVIEWAQLNELTKRKSCPEKAPPSKLLVHLHIPKCAGTSLYHMLKDVYFGPLNSSNANDTEPVCDTNTKEGMEQYINHLRENQLAGFVGFEGIFPWIQKNHPMFTTFCVFRNPIDRVISCAQAMQFDKQDLFRILQADEAMNPTETLRRTPFAHNYMCRMLLNTTRHLTEDDLPAVLEIVNRIDHVYIFEKADWMERVASELELKSPPCHVNASKKWKSAPTQDERDWILQFCNLDMYLYKYVCCGDTSSSDSSG